MPNGAQKQCAKLIRQVTPKEELAEPNFVLHNAFRAFIDSDAPRLEMVG
jgi:hypothetical protein